METLGGAEKRFAGLACAMHARGDTRVKLVVQDPLAALLRSLPELQPFPANLLETFSVGKSGMFAAIRAKLRELHRSEPSAVFHLVTVSPAQVLRFFSRRVLFSEACSSLDLLNWKGKLMSYLGAALATRTDALEQAVAEEYRRVFPLRATSISVTPNSFVDLNFYRSAPVKRNRLTFVGLFAERKQAYRLARCVPAMDAALRAAGVDDPEFYFLGRESGEESMASIIAGFDARVRVVARFDANPVETLAESKVIFSVQRLENYPSKALLEGMACGALPIVTDVGGSRRIARPEFAEFVPGEFSADDVARAAVRVMTLSEAQRAAKTATMRSFLESHFSIEPMIRYYQAIYDELSVR
jgi:glycosyltransferase involved in cell wall biosynthesis